MQEIKVYCDQGHRRWNVATMRALPEVGWREMHVKGNFHTSAMEDGERVGDFGRIVPWWEDSPQDRHSTTTFKCPKCVELNRHTTLTRHVEPLSEVFEELSTAGIHQVTLNFLAAAVDRHARNRS